MSIRLRDATEHDIPAMVQVGLAAFENDELNMAFFPPSSSSPDRHLEERIRFRGVMTRKRMAKPGAHAMVAVDDALDGRIVGYAQWEMPVPASTEAIGNTLEVAEKDESGRPSGLDKKAIDEYVAAAKAELTRVLGPDGVKDAVYLDFLCVDPAQQRRGIARLLISWGIHQARAQGKRFYLSSTPAGRPFYLSVGLEDAGHFEIFGSQQTSMVLPGQKRG